MYAITTHTRRRRRIRANARRLSWGGWALGMVLAWATVGTVEATLAPIPSEVATTVALQTVELPARPEIAAPDARTTPSLTRVVSAAPSRPPQPAWRERLAFEELGLRLCGLAGFEGAPSCFLQGPGDPTQTLYQVGEVVGGYRIVAIDAASVTFEREGCYLWLTLGRPDVVSLGDAPAAPRPSPARGAGDFAPPAFPRPEGGARDKIAGADRKHRTRHFGRPILTTSEAEQVIARWRRDRARRRGIRYPGRFASPMPSGRLSSGFGYRRHPLGGGRKLHAGVDLKAPRGTRVQAAAAGTVTRVTYAPRMGRYIRIRHKDGYETVYGHLARALVKKGQRVNQGQVIAREGSSGMSTGPHLHFEVRKNGKALNPAHFIPIRR